MNNVHRLVVPRRDDPRRTSAPAVPRMGELLILPCVRYERIETPCARRGTVPSGTLEALRQDLTA